MSTRILATCAALFAFASTANATDRVSLKPIGSVTVDRYGNVGLKPIGDVAVDDSGTLTTTVTRTR